MTAKIAELWHQAGPDSLAYANSPDNPPVIVVVGRGAAAVHLFAMVTAMSQLEDRLQAETMRNLTQS